MLTMYQYSHGKTQIITYIFFGSSNVLNITERCIPSNRMLQFVVQRILQTDGQIAIGTAISPVSDYNRDQYDITILIWKVGFPNRSN
jgi:Neprosin